MVYVLAFALTLLFAVLLSERANRSVLSTSVLFLAVAALLGPLGFGVLSREWEGLTEKIAELALFTTLFSDGMRVDWTGVRSWRQPAMLVLLVGMPLTVLLIALVSWLLLGLTGVGAFLLAAVLAPTDPVFAAALVRREAVQPELRRILNVESGLNDGLALPLVLVLLHHHKSGVGELAFSVGGGLLLGAAVSLAAHLLEHSPLFSVATGYRPLAALALALTVFSLATLLGLNEFLAAFSAGATLSRLRGTMSPEFSNFAENVANALKFVALFVFGTILQRHMFTAPGFRGWIVAVLVLFAARPAALVLPMLKSALGFRERVALAWFGPKGFASVLFALIVEHSHIREASQIFDVAAVTVTLSMVLHSSTSAPFADWLSDGAKPSR